MEAHEPAPGPTSDVQGVALVLVCGSNGNPLYHRATLLGPEGERPQGGRGVGGAAPQYIPGMKLKGPMGASDDCGKRQGHWSGHLGTHGLLQQPENARPQMNATMKWKVLGCLCVSAATGLAETPWWPSSPARGARTRSTGRAHSDTGTVSTHGFPFCDSGVPPASPSHLLFVDRILQHSAWWPSPHIDWAWDVPRALLCTDVCVYRNTMPLYRMQPLHLVTPAPSCRKVTCASSTRAGALCRGWPGRPVAHREKKLSI